MKFAAKYLKHLLILLLVVLAVLVLERWRGQRSLKLWKREMAARGEIFEPTRLWPPPSARSLEFSNRLAQVLRELPPRLANYAGQLSGIVQEQPGQARPGSQEPSLPLAQKGSSTNTWAELDALIGQAQPALASLHELMKDPPSGMSYDVVKRLEDDWPPNYVRVRIVAQDLQAAAMSDLHRGDLAAAGRDLATLLSFVKLYEKDPTLVTFMIRMAILGLSVEVCWDALQASGWTEPQLASLQRECLDIGQIPAQLSRTREADRVSRIYQLKRFRSHSYQSWVARYQEIYQSFGCKLPAADAAAPVQLWRQYVFHPLWSFAWADQEELEYLRDVQREIAGLREAAQQSSWLRLKEQLAANHQGYRAPTAAWRFYIGLPFEDHMMKPVGGPGISAPAYPYPDFSRAYFTTMKNLTLHEMVITAIALKRYELRHGNPLASLAALVPDFLAAPPSDLMDGRPLRYRLNSDGSFVLYSVGGDGQDSGGDSSVAVSNNDWQSAAPWAGLDWVWPRRATPITTTHTSTSTSLAERAILQAGATIHATTQKP
jgi:hypothetical protein